MICLGMSRSAQLWSADDVNYTPLLLLTRICPCPVCGIQTAQMASTHAQTELSGMSQLCLTHDINL